jgi:phosphatidylglycerophosphatase A
MVFLLLFFGLIKIDIEYKISLVLVLLVIHFVYYSSFLKQFGSLNDDPNIYTLDETLAIAVAWLFLGKLVFVEVILLFAIFRFFDIFKPLGINKIEKIMKWPPAIRNLADDILAITYAIIIFQIIKIYE